MCSSDLHQGRGGVETGKPEPPAPLAAEVDRRHLGRRGDAGWLATATRKLPAERSIEGTHLLDRLGGIEVTLDARARILTHLALQLRL